MCLDVYFKEIWHREEQVKKRKNNQYQEMSFPIAVNDFNVPYLFYCSKKKKNSDDVQGLYKTFSTIQNVFMMLRKDSLSWLVTMVTSKSKNYVWLGCTSQEELTRKKSFEKFKMEGRKILVLILCSCSLPWLS